MALAAATDAPLNAVPASAVAIAAWGACSEDDDAVGMGCEPKLLAFAVLTAA